MEKQHKSKIKNKKIEPVNGQGKVLCRKKTRADFPVLNYEYKEGQGNEIEMAFDILFGEVEKASAICPQSLN